MSALFIVFVNCEFQHSSLACFMFVRFVILISTVKFSASGRSLDM